MKKNRLAIFLTALFSVSFISTTSGQKPENFQPGYVIIGRDTLKGLILVQDHFNNLKQCVFKGSQSAATRTYSANDLVGYGVDRQSFFYAAEIRNGQQKVFLECIVKGMTSLFAYYDRFFVHADNELKELVELKEEIRRDGKPYMVKRPLYKSVLQEELNDCPAIHEKLTNTTLTKKSLIKLFDDYSVCTANDAMVFETAGESASKVRYGFALGVLIADLNVKSESNYRYFFGEHASGNLSLSFAPSFFVDVPISRKFDVSTGLNWYHTRNELHAESASSNVTQDFFLEVSRVEVPLLLKYTPLTGNIRWSLKAGCGLNGVLKYDSRLVESTSSGYVLNEYDNDLKKNNLLLNALGGLAAEFSLGSKSFIVEGYYSKSGSLVQSSTYAGLSGFKSSVGMFF